VQKFFPVIDVSTDGEIQLGEYQTEYETEYISRIRPLPLSDLRSWEERTSPVLVVYGLRRYHFQVDEFNRVAVSVYISKDLFKGMEDRSQKIDEYIMDREAWFFSYGTRIRKT